MARIDVTKDEQTPLQHVIRGALSGYGYVLNRLKSFKVDLESEYREKYGDKPMEYAFSKQGQNIDMSDSDVLKQLLASTIVLCDIGEDLVMGGYVESAIKSLELANYLNGIMQGKSSADALRSAQAKANAFKRHAENHALKAEVIQYYSTHIDSFKSLDDAAEKISGKIVPVKFRTVHKWISEYRKSMQHAGRV